MGLSSPAITALSGSASCDLEVVSYNVRGLSDFSKRKDVFDFLRNTSADIICLQELHVAAGKEKRL